MEEGVSVPAGRLDRLEGELSQIRHMMEQLLAAATATTTCPECGASLIPPLKSHTAHGGGHDGSTTDGQSLSRPASPASQSEVSPVSATSGNSVSLSRRSGAVDREPAAIVADHTGNNNADHSEANDSTASSNNHDVSHLGQDALQRVGDDDTKSEDEEEDGARVSARLNRIYSTPETGRQPETPTASSATSPLASAGFRQRSTTSFGEKYTTREWVRLFSSGKNSFLHLNKLTNEVLMCVCVCRVPGARFFSWDGAVCL